MVTVSQQGTWPNSKNQLVACQQSGVGLPTAHARSAGAKLGFSRVRIGNSLLTLMEIAQVAGTWAKSKRPTCGIPTKWGRPDEFGSTLELS